MNTPLRILVLEPWLGGSHRAFLESWRSHSAHRLEVHGLAARHWKWRMRSAAWELSRELAEAEPPDLFWASDYLDLASFRGLAPPALRDVPCALYFHENQFSYPAPPGARAKERDLHFGFTNVLSCLAADGLAFNSAFHRDEFRAAAREHLDRLPRPTPRREFEEALNEARVLHPGIELEELPLGAGGETGAALRLVYNHRWEHDKDPLAFLRAVREARRRGARLELVLLGESFGDLPPGCAGELEALAPIIVQRGFAADRDAYARELAGADAVISTARHEFFGISVLEAVAAGATPIVPDRLSYPELLPEAESYRDEDELVSHLVRAAEEPEALRSAEARAGWRSVAERYASPRAARALDAFCAELVAAAK